MIRARTNQWRPEASDSAVDTGIIALQGQQYVADDGTFFTEERRRRRQVRVTVVQRSYPKVDKKTQCPGDNDDSALQKKTRRLLGVKQKR